MNGKGTQRAYRALQHRRCNDHPHHRATHREAMETICILALLIVILWGGFG